MTDQQITSGEIPVTAPPQSLLARLLVLAVKALVGERGSGETQPPPLTTATPPPGFPSQVPLKQGPFEDWSEYTQVEQVYWAEVANPNDVVDVCNYAVQNGYSVRASGHSHNWSPLVLKPGTPQPKTILIDTSQLAGPPTSTVVNGLLHATFGTGTTLEAATAYLESVGNQPAGAAPGYTFSNMPTPGGLTLGGILAIGGHGTSVPWTTPQQEPDLMGCLSNLIVSFKAVTTDPDDPTSKVYAIREFDRSGPDASAFLVHLGRAFLTEVTLAAVPNYYLQLTNSFPEMDDLMAAPTTPQSTDAFSTLLDQYGRVEVIWFPLQPFAWVQCNTRQATLIKPQVDGPYNYGWMNWITQQVSDYFRDWLFAHPLYTLLVMAAEAGDAMMQMDRTVLNGTARDLEIYLTDQTLRMSAFGYVLQLPRANVQAAVSAWYAQVASQLDSCNRQGQYPINGAVEIRCTTVDRQAELGIAGAQPPALAASHSVDSNDPALDTVLWVDVLTFPKTPGSDQFFTTLEAWMTTTWAGDHQGQLRPEWSKGWAYTDDGPWTDIDRIQQWVPSVYNSATDGLTFDWAKSTLAKYDRGNIFTNPWLATLFS